MNKIVFERNWFTGSWRKVFRGKPKLNFKYVMNFLLVSSFYFPVFIHGERKTLWQKNTLKNSFVGLFFFFFFLRVRYRKKRATIYERKLRYKFYKLKKLNKINLSRLMFHGTWQTWHYTKTKHPTNKCHIT